MKNYRSDFGFTCNNCKNIVPTKNKNMIFVGIVLMAIGGLCLIISEAFVGSTLLTGLGYVTFFLGLIDLVIGGVVAKPINPCPHCQTKLY